MQNYKMCSCESIIFFYWIQKVVIRIFLYMQLAYSFI